MLVPYYRSKDHSFTLLSGDCIKQLQQFSFKFDMIFADPPYFLSNGGITCNSGKIAIVNKGDWDKSLGYDHINKFNKEWLSVCREKLSSHGSIWISGTYHNIFSVANNLTELGYRILNVITWVKTNPPPNMSCRYFTHSTEFIIWARKEQKIPHYFNYELMKRCNENKQMTDVWHLPAVAKWEKSCGKHPCQKPVKLLARIISASTKRGDWVLDPFAGSSTTGVASYLLGRKYLGIEQETNFLELSKARREELDNQNIFSTFITRLGKLGLDLKDEVLEEEKFMELPF
jgi:site-specific DNA-methyltransferase (adenine-specific)